MADGDVAGGDVSTWFSNEQVSRRGSIRRRCVPHVERESVFRARRSDPTTLRLARDDANGRHMYPKHVHKALRRYLGIEKSPGAHRFPFNNTEDFAFFGWSELGFGGFRYQ